MLLGRRLVDSASSGKYSLDDWVSHLDVDAVALMSHRGNVTIHMRSDVSVVVRRDKGLDEPSNTISCLAIETLDSRRLWRAAKYCCVSQVDKPSTDCPRLQRLNFRGRGGLEIFTIRYHATY
jgi:hypothetical protein